MALESVKETVARLAQYNSWLVGLLAAYATSLSAASANIEFKVVTVPIGAIGIVLLATMVFLNLSRLRASARIRELAGLLSETELSSSKLYAQNYPSSLNQFGATPGPAGLFVDSLARFVSNAIWAAAFGIAIRHNRLADAPLSHIGWALLGCLALVGALAELSNRGERSPLAPTRPSWFQGAHEFAAGAMLLLALGWGSS